MAELNVLNAKFEKADTYKTDVDLSAEVIKTPVVHQVVKATLAGKRSGNASTKNRSQVSGGGAKPFKQKGTGRARQGSTRAPHMVGGGACFGPSPRDYTQKINKKVMGKAIQSVLADKYQAGKLFIVDKIESTGKTKDLYKEFSQRNLLPGLVVTSSRENKALLAARNLQYGKGVPVDGFSVYEAVRYENLIIEKEALDKLLSRLV